MNRRKKILILCGAVLATGAMRMPFEIALTRELRTAGLLPPELNIGTREKIGQTSSAVALGGLRTLVATFLNLRAFTYFTETRWQDLAESYNIVVDLAPRTGFYWDTGSWHLAYNAASYYLYGSDLPALRRRSEWRTHILDGKRFLERGIANNPGNWQLQSRLGQLLSDSNKIQAFENKSQAYSDAADAFGAAAKIENSPPYTRRAQFYALARVPGREAEALALAEDLYQSNRVRPPTLRCLYFVLQMHANPKANANQLALEIFGTPQKAYDMLRLHWQRADQNFPQDGVAAEILSLESQLGIPSESSFLKRAPTPQRTPMDWFESN